MKIYSLPVIVIMLMCGLMGCKGWGAIETVAPYYFLELNNSDRVDIAGTWDIESNGVSDKPDSSKISCRKKTGFCFEARAFQISSHLLVEEPRVSAIKVWSQGYILAEDIDSELCLYVNRTNKSVAYYTIDQSRCTKIPPSSELHFLKDWFKAN